MDRDAISTPDDGHNELDKPSPYWYASTAVCLETSRASASTAMIGIVAAACAGQFSATFVPRVELAPVSWGLAAYTCYLLIPSALHVKEAIQWHISRSKI